MTGGKLEPRSLTAIVRETYPPPPPLAGWIGFYFDSSRDAPEDAGWFCSGKVHPNKEEALCELAGFRPFEGSAVVEVGRALFGEPASEPESAFPVGNCPVCKELVAPWNKHAKYEGGYSCQPEPAAPGEISELDDRHMRMASPEVQAKFRADMNRRAIEIGMERLVGVANHPISETVTVGTWQLEELLKYADLAEVALRTGFHPPEFLFEPADRSLRQAIDAIKRQRDGWRTHAQPVGMTEELEGLIAAAEHFIRPVSGLSESCYEIRLRNAIADVRETYGREK